MAKFTFSKATKGQEKLRLALDGPAGAGKTWTACTIGTFLAEQEKGRIAVVDSERRSALKYAGDFDFDHLGLPDNDPHTYIDAVQSAAEAGYAVIIVDSLSHAWEGTLDLKDRVQKRSQSKDGFGAWREVTPVHNDLVDSLLRVPAHLIVTMRTKTEYSVDKDEHGKTKITRLGLKPVQRDGVEYEFDVVGDMDLEHNLVVTKSRCSALSDAVINRPGERLARTLYDWVSAGEPLADATAIAKLAEALNAIPDDETRKMTKQTFAGRFGRPQELLASRLAEAQEFVELATADLTTVGAKKPSRPRMNRLFALLGETGRSEDDVRHEWAAKTLELLTVTSFNDLNEDEVERLIFALELETGDVPAEERG